MAKLRRKVWKKVWQGYGEKGTDCIHGFRNSAFREQIPAQLGLELPILWKSKNQFMTKYRITIEEVSDAHKG